jgi:DNA primase
MPDYFRTYIDPKVNLNETHKILCPFHEDHTPSFTYSPEKGLARCWSGPHCGGGDVVWLHQRNYKIASREEAIESICKMLGLHDTEIELSNPIVKIDMQKVRLETLLSRANRAAKDVDSWVELDQIMSVWKPINEVIDDLEVFLKLRGMSV